MTANDWTIPIERLPDGWRLNHCIQSAADDEWWVMLEKQTPWPMRTVGSWGPSLRAAFERACFEATQ